jgi:hypothetical protein
MSVILLSYDQAILVFKLMKTDVSRRNIVTFVDFITGISTIGAAKGKACSQNAHLQPSSVRTWGSAACGSCA